MHIWREEGRGTTASAAMMVKGKRIRILIRVILALFDIAGFMMYPGGLALLSLTNAYLGILPVLFC